MDTGSCGKDNFHTPIGRKPTARKIGSLQKLRQPFKSPFRKTETKCPVNEDALKEEISELQKKCKDADTAIQELIDEGYSEEELQLHITKLHHYNEMKDIGQMLIGKLAFQLGLTTKDLYDRFGLDLDD